MIKNNRILALGLGFIIASSPILVYPMVPVAAKATQSLAKEYLKEVIEKGATCLHWTIAAGPCWAVAAGTMSEIIPSLTKDRVKREKELFSLFVSKERAQEHDKKIQEQDAWIRHELKNQGYSNWETVELIPFNNFCTFSNFKLKAIMYDREQVSSALNEHNSWIHGIKRSKFGISAIISAASSTKPEPCSL